MKATRGNIFFFDYFPEAVPTPGVNNSVSTSRKLKLKRTVFSRFKSPKKKKNCMKTNFNNAKIFLLHFIINNTQLYANFL